MKHIQFSLNNFSLGFFIKNHPKIVSRKVTPDNGQATFVSPQRWRNHLRTTCEHIGHSGNLSLSKFVMNNIIVDDTYKVMYCAIPKVASTTWRRILILLSGKVPGEDLISMHPGDVHHKYSQYLKLLSAYTQDEINHLIENYFKFVFVREPYERLLSAFRNKFLTNTNSSRYFKKAFGRKIINQYRPNSPRDNDGDGLLFSEFVEYLLDDNKKIKMNGHWERFHKMCAPCVIKYDFVGKLESIETNWKFILSQISKEIDIPLPSRSDLKYFHNKTRFYMTDFYSQLSRDSILRLYRMYIEDFLLFNYSIPTEITSLLSRVSNERYSLFNNFSQDNS